jgi:hypothetical protein
MKHEWILNEQIMWLDKAEVTLQSTIITVIDDSFPGKFIGKERKALRRV